MIREYIGYKCCCFKCGHTWATKDHALPKTCAKCKSTKWNDDYAAPVTASQAVPIVLPVPEEWRFTREAPQWADGRLYRGQYLIENPKRTRIVEVEEDDHDVIIHR